MFTGIVEDMATITAITPQENNLNIRLSCSFVGDLQIDQSVAHNGVCLTVVELKEKEYSVTAIHESIQKTNIGSWQVGDLINVERAVNLQSMLDGHIVQGHVDTTLQCTKIENEQGSQRFTFSYSDDVATYLIPKGSVCINGVSLTLASLTDNEFSVAIIPYTLEHTNFKTLQVGDDVNIEFDVIGKYVNRIMSRQS